MAEMGKKKRKKGSGKSEVKGKLKGKKSVLSLSGNKCGDNTHQ